MKCLNRDCCEEVPAHSRYCVICGRDAGFPNVRACLIAEELSSLALRVKEAEDNADSTGYRSVLEDFREKVAHSSAVICRSIGKISELVSNDNQLFATFYQAIGSEARLPENNEWDNKRQPVDSLLFPYYSEHIHFASLTLNHIGNTGYGDYSAVLRETAIKDRASVFEENLILFAERYEIPVVGPLPLGYRADWTNRSSLAVAKLGNKLTSTTTELDFPKILINSEAKDADFIEVHIYGPIHRRAIERISGPEPRRKEDKVLLKSIAGKLKDIGVTMEIIR